MLRGQVLDAGAVVLGSWEGEDEGARGLSDASVESPLS